ncbi:uncharacterized protein LOC108815324 [Raphanus sativus]|uniref:Uncharacterized protein LOC108815324 n=1 Tax=Raphanus sativus TaxID=3726 RepID=A0A6J0K681_RAPSA|nr:uncharacterized protein LOC108815324 [Raphanus sativus]
MDYLFWRIDPKPENHQFVWILWYIWKGRNLKVFSNLDVDPRDTLRLAETESALWIAAQDTTTQRQVQQVASSNTEPRQRRWCFTDGSWKDNDKASGQGWYSTLEGFDSLMGARNVRASLSPLHAEVEALIWAMEYLLNAYIRPDDVKIIRDLAEILRIAEVERMLWAEAQLMVNLHEV